MAASDAIIQIRLPQAEKDEICEQAKLEGYESVTAYMRHLARVERLRHAPKRGGRKPIGGSWDSEEIEVARRKDRNGQYVLTAQQVSLALGRKRGQVDRIRMMSAEECAEEAAWARAETDALIEQRAEQDRQWRAAQIRAAGHEMAVR